MAKTWRLIGQTQSRLLLQLHFNRKENSKQNHIVSVSGDKFGKKN